MGTESVLAWRIRSGWKSIQTDIPSKESEPVCPLMYCEVQDIMCATEDVLSQNVCVDQLSTNDVCTVEEMKRPDEISSVVGETNGSRYVCTVCTEQPVECRCVDSVGSDAIGRESANQKIRSRCSFTQTKGDILLTEGGGTHASGSFRRNN